MASPYRSYWRTQPLDDPGDVTRGRVPTKASISGPSCAIASRNSASFDPKWWCSVWADTPAIAATCATLIAEYGWVLDRLLHRFDDPLAGLLVLLGTGNHPVAPGGLSCHDLLLLPVGPDHRAGPDAIESTYSLDHRSAEKRTRRRPHEAHGPPPTGLQHGHSAVAASTGGRGRSGTGSLSHSIQSSRSSGGQVWEMSVAVDFERRLLTPRLRTRNGTRSKTITTAAGDLDLSITKLRTGSFFPSLLERRRRIDQALFAVIMEAYVTGTSVRKVDDLVKALGADTGISKSEVSRICADLDEQVASFADRDLSETAFPYMFLDATYCKARVGGARNGKGSRVVSQAIVVATGVSSDGRREVVWRLRNPHTAHQQGISAVTTRSTHPAPRWIEAKRGARQDRQPLQQDGDRALDRP